MTTVTGWSRARVLVTGASGFLGRHLCAALTALGADVVRTSRRHRSEPGTWVRSDLGSIDDVDEVLRVTAPTVVVHLGGEVSARPDPALVRPTFTSLLASSVGLLEAAQDGRLRRLVLVGSTEEPRAGEVPASPYAAAKAAAVSYARLHASWGAPVVTVRPSMVFGPGQSPDKLLPYVARTLLAGRRPELTSGARRADWIYVDDAVDGLLRAAERAPHGCEVDIGSGRLTSTRELVDRLRAALGTDLEPRWGALPDRPGEPSRAADADATARVLGWRARYSLDDGLRAAAASWRAEASA